MKASEGRRSCQHRETRTQGAHCPVICLGDFRPPTPTPIVTDVRGPGPPRTGVPQGSWGQDGAGVSAAPRCRAHADCGSRGPRQEGPGQGLGAACGAGRRPGAWGTFSSRSPASPVWQGPRCAPSPEQAACSFPAQHPPSCLSTFRLSLRGKFGTFPMSLARRRLSQTPLVPSRRPPNPRPGG